MSRLTPAYPAAALFLLLGAPPVGDPLTKGEDPTVEAPRATAEASVAPPDLDQPFAAPGASVAGLRSEVDRLLGSPAWRNARWSVLAVSLATGDTLLAVDPHRPLIPASNQKLVTSAAALHYLGPQFRFSTFLLARGPVVDGVLHGDLILYGTGDPTFSDGSPRGSITAFPEFLREMRAAGIREVRGDVVGDGTYFEGPFRRDGWNPRSLNDWYAAPVSALSFNENVATLRIQAARAGSPPRVVTVPEAANLALENQGLSVAGRPGRPFMAIRDDPDTPIVLRGHLTEGSRELTRVITVSDPPIYAASVFRRYLEDEGITVHGETRAIRDRSDSALPGGAPIMTGSGVRGGTSSGLLRTVAVHQSPPLGVLLRRVNVESHNLFAELMVFTLGRVVRGKGSFEEGTRVLSHFLTEVLGVVPEELSLDDGSGLSRENRLTAGSLVRVLEHMSQENDRDAFWESLPVAGDRRGIARMYRTAAAGNLRAKTGTIARVSSLSGIVTTADGEPVAFSILANEIPSLAAKGIEDEIGIRLASFTRSGGREIGGGDEEAWSPGDR